MVPADTGDSAYPTPYWAGECVLATAPHTHLVRSNPDPEGRADDVLILAPNSPTHALT